MFTRLLARLALVASLALPAGFSLAQDDEEDQPPATPQVEQPQAPKKELSPEDKAKAYDAAVKDLPKSEGAFTLLQRKNEILMQLGEGDIGKIWLIQATLGTGVMPMTLQAGDPVGDEAIDAFYWEKHDDALWLNRPNFRFRWTPNDPLALASDRSFQKAILGSFKIEQSNPLKKLLLVNVTNLFMGDVFRLSELVNAGGGTYALDREKCYVAKMKSFKDNTVVRMQLHFWSARPPQPNPIMLLLGMTSNSMLEDARSMPLSVTYNVWYRQNDGYMPRMFDSRVGFFTTTFFDVSKFTQVKRDERYIERFPLKKKDPTAKLSDPVKPIVWTIDPSVPPEYRQACKDGVLMWNEAFEALGYKNAIQVQDPPNDPDYDHADGRYNVIRWTISPDLDGAYAIAQFRSDPFTGEILNAAVTVDANYMAAAFSEQQSWVTPAADRLQLALTANAPSTELWKSDLQLREDGLRKLMDRHGWTRIECRFAEGLSQSAAFAWNTLQSAPGGMQVSRENYAKQMLRETVCHEVGHCLGLRHNFTGSTYLTTAQLGQDQTVRQQGDTASLMDYCPVNVLSALKGSGYFYSPRIGVYDKWAIRYGYGDVKADAPIGELPALSQVASHSGEPGLAYMTDENADAWDPFVLRYDQSKDPLDYMQKVFEAAARVRKYAVEKLPRPGGTYEKRTQMLMSSLLQTFNQGRFAAYFVGGVHGARSRRGDVGEKPTLAPIDSRLQRQAVRLIAKNCLSVDSLGVPESVMLSLSLDPDDETGAAWTAPVRQLISSRESLLFGLLMAPDVAARIGENEFKLGGKGAYTLAEHFATVVGAVFGEIGADRSVSSTRRDLQQFAVAHLIAQAGAAPNATNGDVRVLASDALRGLSHRLGLQLQRKKNLDRMSVLHFKEMKLTIDRFLSRQVSSTR